VVESRKIEGDELNRVLGSKKPSGFDYGPYHEVLDQYADGDVIAVPVPKAQERGEKIRFARAARLRSRSLTWLQRPNDQEIAFQIGPLRTQRQRTRKPAQS
jgi:hypothetical protein